MPTFHLHWGPISWNGIAKLSLISCLFLSVPLQREGLTTLAWAGAWLFIWVSSVGHRLQILQLHLYNSFFSSNVGAGNNINSIRERSLLVTAPQSTDFGCPCIVIGPSTTFSGSVVLHQALRGELELMQSIARKDSIMQGLQLLMGVWFLSQLGAFLWSYHCPDVV